MMAESKGTRHRFTEFFHRRSKSKKPLEESTRHADVLSQLVSNNDNAGAFQRNSTAIEGFTLQNNKSAADNSEATAKNPLKKRRHALEEKLDAIDKLPIDSSMPDDAYMAALQYLSEEDRRILSISGKKGEINILLQQLLARDQQNQARSLLNRKTIRSSVEKVGMVCDYVDLLTPFIPVGQISPAITLVKGVIGIMLGICGVYQELTGNIDKLLEFVPILHRYTNVVKSDYRSDGIFKNLVIAYICLLYFYTWVMEFFSMDRFIDRVFEPFRSEIPGIVSTFDGVVAKINSLTQAEANAITMELQQQQAKAFVEEKFTGCQALTYDNTYDKISKAACKWLLDDSQFQAWHGSDVKSGLLLMFGKMGCGKSATAAFVWKHLQEGNEGSNMPVLVHRCKEQEASVPLDLYRNLTYQLLRARPKLQANFMEWYEKCKQEQHFHPLHEREPPLLQNYFKEVIQEMGDSTTFIIVDGLDEMKPKQREELLKFLKELVQGKSCLKVFLTSRESESDDVYRGLGQEKKRSTDPGVCARRPGRVSKPVGVSRAFLPSVSQGKVPIFDVAMTPGSERDFILAEYLLAQYSEWSDERTRQDLLKKVATQLSQSSQGSAIWLQMAAQTLEGRNLADENGFERQLAWLQDGPPLNSLYETLLARQKRNSPGTQASNFLDKALEVLAVAQRPLTVLELSCVVCMDGDREKALSLAQLNEQAENQESFVKRLVGPFITFARTQDGMQFPVTQDRMELVHSSLLELILKAPPSKWKTLQNSASESETSASDYDTFESDSEVLAHREKYQAQRQEELLKRRAKLHADMLKRCLKYVMSKELNELNIRAALEGDGTTERAADLAFMQGFDCPDEDTIVDGTDLLLGREFDPAKHGFGVFFAYTGAFWLHHFAECPPERRPSYAVLASLCAHDSACLKNWAEMWKRPSAKYVVELPYIDVKELDPLAVFSRVEPTAATLVGIAKVKEEKPQCFLKDTEWKLLMNLTQRGEVEVVRDLLCDSYMGTQLLSWPYVLGDILTRLHQSATYGTSKGTEDWPGSQWIDIFDAIIEKLGGRLSEGARFALEVACRTGCLALVKRLFIAGDRFPTVRTNLLSVRDKPEDSYNNLGIYKHQPLGMAAHCGHAGIVRFLCQQEGIEAQLHYTNKGGYNVFHVLAAPQSRCDEEIVATLLNQWPDGIHQPCKNGDTALNVLVFTGTPGELLTTWLRLVQFNPAVLDGEPMRVAVANSDFGACNVLVREANADPWKVVEISAHGKPRLREERPFIHEGMPAKAQQLLAGFSTLIPLTVATDELA